MLIELIEVDIRWMGENYRVKYCYLIKNNHSEYDITCGFTVPITRLKWNCDVIKNRWEVLDAITDVKDIEGDDEYTKARNQWWRNYNGHREQLLGKGEDT
jgi:hypothetical protein